MTRNLSKNDNSAEDNKSPNYKTTRASISRQALKTLFKNRKFVVHNVLNIKFFLKLSL